MKAAARKLSHRLVGVSTFVKTHHKSIHVLTTAIFAVTALVLVTRESYAFLQAAEHSGTELAFGIAGIIDAGKELLEAIASFGEDA